MTAFLLHTGVSKTGSTTLQAGFARHPGVFSLGKSADYPGPEGSRSEEVFDALNALLWQRPHTAHTPLTTTLPALLASPDAAGRVTVASWEALGSKPTAVYRGMVERLTGACPQTRILCCLRHPATWLVSTYLQHLRGQFLRRHRDDLFGGRPWMPFEEWLTRSEPAGFHGLTAQLPNLRTAVEILGRERVGVVLFEQLQTQPDAFYRSIAAFAEIDPVELLRHTAHEHKNPRLTQAAFAHMQHVAATPGLCEAWRGQSPEQRRSGWRAAELHSGSLGSVRFELPAAWQPQVAALVQDDAAWLEATLGTPLREIWELPS